LQFPEHMHTHDTLQLIAGTGRVIWSLWKLN